MTDDEFISKLKSTITMSEQINIFSNNNYIDKIIEDSVNYLRYKGFKITSPKKFTMNIHSVDDLIKYFYLLLNSNTLNAFMTSSNVNRDRMIARTFINSRMEITGNSQEYALNECGEIIKTIFERKEEFKFKYAINFSIFGQKNLKWVTDKALQLMNIEVIKKEEEEGELLRQQMIDAQDTSNLGFNDLDALLANMED